MSWLKMIKAGSVQSYCWPQSWEANVSNFLSLKDLFPNIWDHDHLLTGCCKYNFEVSTSESWMSRYVFFSSAVFLIQGLNLYVLTTTKKKNLPILSWHFILKRVCIPLHEVHEAFGDASNLQSLRVKWWTIKKHVMKFFG